MLASPDFWPTLYNVSCVLFIKIIFYYCVCYYCRSTVIVAWGESGAIGQTVDDEHVESPAFLAENAVDTLGAGDTFVAVTILSLSKGCSLKDSITAGCRVAGAKVTAHGFSAIHPGLLLKE